MFRLFAFFAKFSVNIFLCTNTRKYVVTEVLSMRLSLLETDLMINYIN